MASFTALVQKGHRREDGTWRVYIRFIYQRKSRFIPTEMYVSKKGLTSSFKIKDTLILRNCDTIISAYKKRMYELNIELLDIDIDSAVALIINKSKSESINLDEWAEIFYKKIGLKVGSLSNYEIAVNKFKKFMHKDVLTLDDINKKNLVAFSESLRNTKSAKFRYCIFLRKMFNSAREYYNDEDRGIIVIKHSIGKLDIPKVDVPEKRALSLDTIRKIFALDLNTMKCKTERMSIELFKLSFALMGMNIIDIFEATRYEDGVIKYNRSKTKAQRPDKAYIEVKIPKQVEALAEKYFDKINDKNKRVFNLHRKYKNVGSLKCVLTYNMRKLSDIVGEKVTYYSARHSMATIAVNDVGIDKYTVHEMLNHSIPSMAITDVYIKKDFRRINEAMQRVMDYVLGDMNAQDI